MVWSRRCGLTTGAVVSLTATASALLLGCSPESRSRFVVSPPRPRHRRGLVFSKVSSPSDQEGGWGSDWSQRGKTTQMRLVGESLERRAYIYEARLASPLGIKLAEQNSASTFERDDDDDDEASDSARPASRVVVAGVERGSTAWDAGVRAGDCIVATGATWGGGMHLTSTVDGVTAAVTSRVKMFGDVNLRFERPFDSADEVSWRSVVAETFIVELAKPLGIELTEKGEGVERAVYVKTLDPAGNAALSGQVKVDDRIVAVSASIGNGLWDANSVEGVVSAVATRQLNQPIRFKLERQVSVGAWRELDGRDGSDDEFDEAEENEERIAAADDALRDSERREDSTEGAESDNEGDGLKEPGETLSPPTEKKRDVLGMESAAAALDSLRGTDVSTASTQAVLFERSCALLHKYGNAGSSSGFTGRTGSSSEEVRAALENVRAVLDVVLAAPVVPPPKLMNMGMIAFLKLRRPLEAVTFFDRCFERGSLPNVLVATTLAKVLSKKPTFDTTAATATTKAATASTEVPLLKVKKGSSPALPSPVPQLAAVLASLEKQRLPLDSQFLNQLMQCYLIRGHLREAEDVFYRALKAGGASAKEELSRLCAPTQSSWNIMLDGYARLGRAASAQACFDDMVALDMRPDLYSYTALIKALVACDDFAGAEKLLSSMEDASFKDPLAPRPDRFLYNTLLEGYAKRLRWREAEHMLNRLASAGLTPNEDTFATLVPCLVRSQHPERAVECLQELRDLNLRLDTRMYTSFITAYARLGDAVSALELLREMKLAGVTVNIIVFGAVMDACLRAKNPDLALALAAELRKSLEPDEVVYSFIVRAYGMKWEVRKAALLVAALQREHNDATTADASSSSPSSSTPSTSTKLVKPSVVLYNALLREAVACRSWAIAIGAFTEILQQFRPNAETYAALAQEPRRLHESAEGNEVDWEEVGLHSRFLFEVVTRVKDTVKKTPKSNVRIAGDLYARCLEVALQDNSSATADAAVSLIAARRRGEVPLRLKDEGVCVEAERAWEDRLGRVIEGGEWQAFDLFREVV